ncbi:MAG: VWA domain-containing protein [Deltaproteobacteria bacterium]|nr:VWA domain-containing protein [Deltaproteobacteria bacterium]
MIWHSAESLWLLLALPIVVGLFLLSWRLRKRATESFGSPSTVARIVVGRAPGLRATRALILVLALGFSIIALARPQYGSRTRMLRKRGVDVVVVLDFSKSMLARDVKPNRIERAKAELTEFISKLGGDRIGIVAFAGETMEFPMTVDYAAAALFFRELGPYDMPVGGTAIGRALVAAKRLLERSKQDKGESKESSRAKVVMLMTDGEDHEGDPAAAAKQLAEIGARVYVVGIGSRTGEPIPTYAEDGTWTGYLRDEDGNPIVTALTSDNEKQLKEIASLTGGKYFRARPGSVGMDQIRQEMSRMKQTELRARRITIHEERYALVLLIAFLLLVLEALLPEAWFRPGSVREGADGRWG